jgi:putative transposase
MWSTPRILIQPECEFSGISEPWYEGRKCHEEEAVAAEQITFALRRLEAGTAVEEVCRKPGVSEATFYRWKKKFGGIGVAEVRRLMQLEEENRQFSTQAPHFSSAPRRSIRPVFTLAAPIKGKAAEQTLDHGCETSTLGTFIQNSETRWGTRNYDLIP